MQIYLPPANNIGKDFLRAVFKDEKQVLKNESVRKITIPKYAELSVANFFEVMAQDEKFLSYFPDHMPKGR